MLLPNASAPAASLQLDGLDGEFLESYQSMRLGRIRSSHIPLLHSRATAEGVQVLIEDDFDKLFFAGGAVDTRLGTAGSHPGRSLRAPYSGGSYGLYTVQFIGPAKAEWLERLETLDVRIVQWVPLNGAIIVAQPDGIARTLSEPFVQYADIYHPFLKPGRLDNQTFTRDFLIHVAKAPDVETDLHAIQASAAALPKVLDSGEEDIWLQARMTPEQATALLDLPLVLSVSDLPSFRVSDERVTMSLTAHVGGTGAPTSPTRYKKWLESICSYCGNLASEGFRVGVADATGIDGGRNGTHHADLAAARVTYGTNFADPGDTELSDPGGHATMVAGIIAGDPAPTAAAGAGGFLYGSGVAPSAGVVATVVAMQNSIDYYPAVVDPAIFTPITSTALNARQNGAYVQNHSYNRYTAQDCNSAGCPIYMDGEYDTTSAQFDQEVRSNHMTLVVSSGNVDQQMANAAGYPIDCAQPPDGQCVVPYRLLTLPPATAKNVIAVGGAENVREAGEQWNCHQAGAASYSNVMSNSKQGTRVPGYIKPDLMAPSANITSLRSTDPRVTGQGWCNFGSFTPATVALNSSSYIAVRVPVGRRLSRQARQSSPAAATPRRYVRQVERRALRQQDLR